MIATLGDGTRIEVELICKSLVPRFVICTHNGKPIMLHLTQLDAWHPKDDEPALESETVAPETE